MVSKVVTRVLKVCSGGVIAVNQGCYNNVTWASQGVTWVSMGCSRCLKGVLKEYQRCISGHLQVFDMDIRGLSHGILPNGEVPLGGSALLEDGAGLKV